jgi:hypothetical protein
MRFAGEAYIHELMKGKECGRFKLNLKRSRSTHKRRKGRYPIRGAPEIR